MAPKLCVLVTTMDEKGRADVSPISFVTPVSFDPPLLMLSVGPNKHSYWAMMRVKEFVINIPTEKILDKLWKAGGKWDEHESKIKRAGFKTAPSDKVKPPLLTECPINLECFEEFSKKAGDHIMVVARVAKIHVDPEYIDDDGYFKVDEARPPLHVADNIFAFPYVTKKVDIETLD